MPRAVSIPETDGSGTAAGQCSPFLRRAVRLPNVLQEIPVCEKQIGLVDRRLGVTELLNDLARLREAKIIGELEVRADRMH